MIKKEFIKNAVAVSIVSLTMSILGVLFRTYASTRVGAETMGLLQLVLSVYYPACTLATSGIYVASTRLCTEAMARKQKNIGKILSRCLIYSLIFGLGSFLLLFSTSEMIAQRWLSFPEAKVPLQILSIGLPFLSAANALQGFFLSLQKASYSTVLQVTEDLSKIATTVLLFTLFLNNGPQAALCAMVAGMAIGEIFSCLFGFMLYLAKNKSKNAGEHPIKQNIFAEVVKIAMPCAFSGCLRSGLGMIENILVPRGLESSGLSPEQTLSILGKLEGMALPILIFPAAFLAVVSKLLIPEITAENSVGNHKNNLKTIKSILTWTMGYGVFIGSFAFIFGKDLGLTIYHDSDCGKFLTMLAPMVPILYGDKVIDGIMKGYNQQLTTMKINLADAIFQTAGAFFLIPKTGIFGYITIFCVGSFCNFTMSYLCLKKNSKVQLPIRDGILKPLLLSLASMIPLKIIGQYIKISIWIRAILSATLFISFIRLWNLNRSTISIPAHRIPMQREPIRTDHAPKHCKSANSPAETSS